MDAKQEQAKRIRDEGVSKRQERFRLQMDRAEEAARRLAQEQERKQQTTQERLDKATENREEAMAKVLIVFVTLTSSWKINSITLSSCLF